MLVQEFIKNIIALVIIILIGCLASIVYNAPANAGDQNTIKTQSKPSLENINECMVCTADLIKFIEAENSGDIQAEEKYRDLMQSKFCIQEFGDHKEYYCPIFFTLHKQRFEIRNLRVR